MAKADTDGNIDAALLSVPADGAMEALDEAGDQALALIAAWIKQSNAAAVQEVAERGSGKSRKAARRGLNVLKSRGVELPERHHVASLGGGRGEETFEAYMLAPDTAGNVLLVVTARAPASRIRSVFVFLNDEQGVHRVDQGELSQSQLRDSLARVLPGAEYKAVKVPVEWTRARIAAARRRHAETGQPEPLGLDSAASLLDPAPDEVPPTRSTRRVWSCPRTMRARWRKARASCTPSPSSAAGSRPAKGWTSFWPSSARISSPARARIPKP